MCVYCKFNILSTHNLSQELGRLELRMYQRSVGRTAILLVIQNMVKTIWIMNSKHKEATWEKKASEFMNTSDPSF